MKSIFIGVLSSSIAASIFFLLIYFISCIFRKIPARIQYYLWLVLILVIIIPQALFSKLDISPLLKNHQTNAVEPYGDPPYAAAGTETGNRTIETPDLSVKKDSAQRNTPVLVLQKNLISEKFVNMFFYIWISGVIVILTTYIAANALFLLKIRKSPVIENEEINGTLSALCVEMGILKKIRIIELNSIKSPAIYGLHKPVILVKNAGFLMQLEKKKLKLLLMHELQHYRSWDNLVKIIGAFLKALHWFNPFIWLAFQKISIIQEYKCDEEVVNPLEKEVQSQYANLILDVYELLVPASSFLRKPSFIKLRIQKILASESNRPMKLNFQVALILLLILCTFQITNVLSKEPIQRLNTVVDDRQATADLYVHSIPYGIDEEFVTHSQREPEQQAVSQESEPGTPIKAAAPETAQEPPSAEMQQAMKGPADDTPQKHQQFIEVSFRDKAFEAVVRKLINKNEGPIYDTDLKHIEELEIIGNTLITNKNTVLDEHFNKIGYTADNGLFYNFSECDEKGGISSLEDLEFFPGLVRLTIRHNRLKGVSGVENLKSIRFLDLAFNQIRDLKGMDLIDQDMKYINLSYNRISDITRLAKLPSIKDHLDLCHNDITDIDTLGNISVPFMSLSGNPVMDDSAVVTIPGEGQIIKKP